MYKKIKKIIVDTTTKPNHLDKLNDLYNNYVWGRDELSPTDFCDNWEVEETKVSYNQARYWLFDDNLYDIVWDQLRPDSKEEKDLIEELVNQWYEMGTKQEI